MAPRDHSLTTTPAVVVFAKSPEPGQVKTRLCPPLTMVAAAELHRACVRDLWSRLIALSGLHPILCHDPPASAPLFRELLGPEADLLPQTGGDLGDRLVAGFQSLFARGLGPVLAIGADSPDLPLPLLNEAAQLLRAEAFDVVLGPALDGGYTLIGLSRFHPELFRAVPWSTAAVLAVTRERCMGAGLRVHLLDPWEDVDDSASLDRLRERVLSRPPEFPHLIEFFRTHPGGDMSYASPTPQETVTSDE